MSTQADRSYRWLFWCLALVGLAIDQGSKYGVFAWLYNGTPNNYRAVIPGAFWLNVKFSGERDAGKDFLSPLRTVGGDLLPEVNHGALWGLGGKTPDGTGTGMNDFFALISLGAALAIAAWSFRAAAARERFLCISLGLILAGTLGNLYDRVVFSGVRDFLHWNYLFDFPVFNLADCCLVCGAGLLLLQAFYGQPDSEEQLAAQAAAAAPEQVAQATQ